MNRPQTVEGHQLWQLVGALWGQLRVAPSGRVLGWDMAAALQLGAAMGLPRRAVAAVLPDVERVMVVRLDEARKAREGGDR